MLAALSFFIPFAGSALSAAPAAVYSDVYGVIRSDLPAGGHLISPPLVEQRAFQGAVIGLSGSDGEIVSLDTVTALETPHYLIASGQNAVAAGHYRSIVSSDMGSVTLESPIAGLGPGDTVQVIILYSGVYRGQWIDDRKLYDRNGL